MKRLRRRIGLLFVGLAVASLLWHSAMAATCNLKQTYPAVCDYDDIDTCTKKAVFQVSADGNACGVKTKVTWNPDGVVYEGSGSGGSKEYAGDDTVACSRSWNCFGEFFYRHTPVDPWVGEDYCDPDTMASCALCDPFQPTDTVYVNVSLRNCTEEE